MKNWEEKGYYKPPEEQSPTDDVYQKEKWTRGMQHDDILVLGSENGSMQKYLFMQSMKNFIENLPKNQGKGQYEDDNGVIKEKEPVILFLDGHSSRWCLPALKYLQENGVHLFFFPSHTSIITQPNDNGVNASLHSWTAKSTRQLRWTGSGKPSITYYNEILSVALTGFWDEQRRLLLHTGQNAASWAFTICGIKPFDPNCPNWVKALSTYGKCREDDEEDHLKDEFSIKYIDLMPDINLAELDAMKKAYDPHRPLAELDCRLAARGIAEKMIAKWRSKVFTTNDGAIPLVPTSEVEKTALKLVELVNTREVAKHIPRAITEEELKRAKKTAMVDATSARGELVIDIRRDGRIISNAKAMKHETEDRWFVFDGKNCENVSSEELKSSEDYIIHDQPESGLSEKERAKKRKYDARLEQMKRRRAEELAKREVKEQYETEVEKCLAMLNKEAHNLRLIRPETFDSIRSFLQTPYTAESNGVKVTIQPGARPGQEIAAMTSFFVDTFKDKIANDDRARRIEELDRAAKRQKRSGVPGTARGLDGAAAVESLKAGSAAATRSNMEAKVKELTKECDELRKLFQNFESLKESKAGFYFQYHKPYNEQGLTNSEVKILLKICYPSSGVVSKPRKNHVEALNSKLGLLNESDPAMRKLRVDSAFEMAQQTLLKKEEECTAIKTAVQTLTEDPQVPAGEQEGNATEGARVDADDMSVDSLAEVVGMDQQHETVNGLDDDEEDDDEEEDEDMQTYRFESAKEGVAAFRRRLNEAKMEDQGDSDLE
jgi:hypothetical protein